MNKYDELKKQYLEDKGFGCTKATVRRSERIINQFLSAINKEIVDVNEADVINWFKEQEAKGKSRTYIIATLRIVRSLFKYGIAVGELTTDPTYRVIYSIKPLPKKIQPKISDEEIVRLLNAARGNIRDYALLKLLVDCGLRSREICNLKVTDLDLEKCATKVQDSYKRGSYSFFSSECCLAIKEHLNCRSDESPYLFTTVNGRQLSSGTVLHILKKYVLTAKIDKQLNTYTLRRCYAEKLFNKGASTKELLYSLRLHSINSLDNHLNWILYRSS